MCQIYFDELSEQNIHANTLHIKHTSQFPMGRHSYSQGCLSTSPFFPFYLKDAIIPRILSFLPYIFLNHIKGNILPLFNTKLIPYCIQKRRERKIIKKKLFTKQILNGGLTSFHPDFQVRDLEIKWNKLNEPEGKHTNFQQLWLGPFEILEYFFLGTYISQNMDGEIETLPINGHILKQFFSLFPFK